MNNPIIILGCTASGKSDLGEALAARLGATVMAVDSMQVYRGMDIGTAKPSAAERARVPYLMLDVADPWESYSAARFVEQARPLVEQHLAQDKPLVLVAGTILYLRALVEGLFEGPGADEAIRAELQAQAAAQGTAALHAQLTRIDPVAAARIHPNDQRRIIRALEVFHLTGTPISTLQTQWKQQHTPGAFAGAAYIGIRRDKELLGRRINTRVRNMMERGLVEEVRRLATDPRGFSQEAASAVGYKQLLEHFAGGCTLEEAVERIKIQTRYLAKMQRTWLKRWPGPAARVLWLDAPDGTDGSHLADAVLAAIMAKGT